MRILVVDNDRATATLQVKVLQTLGHEGHACLHGNQALEMIERIRPDVAILDLAMPEMSGLEIADELRRRPELRPRLLIAVTGFGDDSIRVEILAAGFDAYFLKPVQVHRLKAAIDALSE